MMISKISQNMTRQTDDLLVYSGYFVELLLQS